MPLTGSGGERACVFRRNIINTFVVGTDVSRDRRSFRFGSRERALHARTHACMHAADVQDEINNPHTHIYTLKSIATIMSERRKSRPRRGSVVDGKGSRFISSGYALIPLFASESAIRFSRAG